MNEHDEWLLDRSFYEYDDFEEFVWACAACGTLHFEEDRYGICPACGALVKPEDD